MLVCFKKVPKEMCSEYIMGRNGVFYLIFPANSIVPTLPLSQLLFLKSIHCCTLVLPESRFSGVPEVSTVLIHWEFQQSWAL